MLLVVSVVDVPTPYSTADVVMENEVGVPVEKQPPELSAVEHA